MTEENKQQNQGQGNDQQQNQNQGNQQGQNNQGQGDGQGQGQEAKFTQDDLNNFAAKIRAEEKAKYDKLKADADRKAELDKMEENDRLKAEKEDVEKQLQEMQAKIKYNEERTSAATKLSEAKSEIKKIIDEVRKSKSEKITRRAYSRIGEIETENRNTLNAHEKEVSPETQYQKIDWTKVKIGDKFLVKDMNQIVEITELPDKKENLTVQMGIMKMKLKIKYL